MKKHSDYITHISNEEDTPYLRSKLLDVNMRLFETSPEYKAIILQQCEYLKMLVLTQMEGYKKPHGMSSANAGLAFNIITIARNRGKKDEYAEVMINPKITRHYGYIGMAESNCGSITLKEPIKIPRNYWIDVTFYDEQGKPHKASYNRDQQAFTIQHEVDHNNGVLITDKI